MQTQTADRTPKEVVFDDQGQTVEVHPEVDPVADAARAAAEGNNEGSEAATDSSDEQPKKFRIGDREFTTQDEALAFATSQVSTLQTEAQVADAYRQGIRDAMTQPQGAGQSVTPEQPPPLGGLNPEEMYTKPTEFLQKYGEHIKKETRAEFEQRETIRVQSDQIWREFTDRHPELADFRTEVEGFVSLNNPDVRAIIQTKGRDASYDFIATKLKARWSSYETALKPKRALANTGGSGSPANAKGGNVTPKEPVKKPLSLDEQLRTIRKGRR